MEIKLKYLDNSQLKTFLRGMKNTPTEELLKDPSVINLSKRCIPKELKENELGLAEGFLLLFEDREEYEFCEKIIKAYPELKIDKF